MCQLFDAQVRKILSAIDKHLDGVLSKMPELHLVVYLKPISTKVVALELTFS